MRMIEKAGLCLLSAACATTALAGPAPFDGPWSVSVTPTQGACPPNNLPIDVRAGQVVAVAGMSGVSAGGISPTGCVDISVAAGGRSIAFTGAAKGVAASGTWASDDRACLGRWSAARR